MSKVVIGRLVNPDLVQSTINEETQPVDSFDYRAMWQWLRLQFNRKDIDLQIKTQVSEPYPNRTQRLKAMKEFFRHHVELKKEQRPLQYIFSGSHVAAVATLKHLLVPPEKVYETAQRILKQNPETTNLFGDVYILKETKKINLGLQIFAGNITTRNAIYISANIRINECFNPLSWLGSSSFKRWGVGDGAFSRVLRITSMESLEPRLEAAINKAVEGLGKIKMKLRETKQKPLTRLQGKRIFAAMAWSYNVGFKVMNQVFERWAEEADSLYGLSMAASWVAHRGEFSPTGESMPQRLASVAAAVLMVQDVEKAEKHSLDWLKAHIKEGKTKSLEELQKELKIK